MNFPTCSYKSVAVCYTWLPIVTLAPLTTTKNVAILLQSIVFMFISITTSYTLFFLFTASPTYKLQAGSHTHPVNLCLCLFCVFIDYKYFRIQLIFYHYIEDVLLHFTHFSQKRTRKRINISLQCPHLHAAAIVKMKETLSFRYDIFLHTLCACVHNFTFALLCCMLLNLLLWFFVFIFFLRIYAIASSYILRTCAFHYFSSYLANFTALSESACHIFCALHCISLALHRYFLHVLVFFSPCIFLQAYISALILTSRKFLHVP